MRNNLRRRRKLTALSIFAAVLGMFLLGTIGGVSIKATDPIVEEISNYRNWNKVTKEPVKVDLRSLLTNSPAPLATGGFPVDGLSGGG